MTESQIDVDNMAGVLFVVCIPTGKYEKRLKKNDFINARSDIKRDAFNFNVVKSSSSENLLKVRAGDKSASSRSSEEVGNVEELTGLLLKPKSDIVFIDVDSVADLSKSRTSDDVERREDETMSNGDATHDVNLNRTPTLLDLPQQDEDPVMEKVSSFL